MQKLLLIIGAALGALGVGIGAFGAHAFKAILEANQRVATFETGVKYHLVHVLAILVTAVLMDRFPHRFFHFAGVAFIAGILLFSGSLYILSLTGNTKWGAVAPIGGTAFVLGWLLMLVAFLKSS